MSPDTPRSDRPAAPSGDKYLDAIHEVSEREKGAHVPDGDGDVEPPRRRPRADDESADPVGDGHSDDDFARREPRERP